MTEGGLEDFRTPHSDIGVKVRSRRVRDLDIKDLSLDKLAVLALEDTEYCQMVHHLKGGHDLKHI